MRKAILIFFFTTILILLAAYVYLHRDRGRVLDKTRTVYIEKVNNKFKLYRNGKPFYIKGASGTGYLKEMAEAGGNTLRVYDTLNLKTLLDEAQKFNIAVIVDIPLPTSGHAKTYYSDMVTVRNLKLKVKNLVSQYKDHPSILAWNLGNELIFPLTIKNNNFIKVFNDLVDLIHNIDPNHPVSTSVSGTSRAQTLGIHLSSPKLDLIGFNAFGSITRVESVMNNIKLITNPKPYFIMEWGNHGPWEAPINIWKSILEPSSTLKSGIYNEVYTSYIEADQNCLGSLAFYWGYKQEGTPTWFNIFDQYGRKSDVYYELTSLWTGKEVQKILPEIKRMSLNNLELNHQVFSTGSVINAEITMQKAIDSTLSFHYKIFREAWGRKQWNSEIDSLRIVANNSTFSNSLKFKSPNKEGPYRVFVTVHDLKGNFATANMPFYVLNHE